MIFAVATLAASLFMTQAAFSTAAQAHCDGGSQTTTYLIVDNVTYASENPIYGTCNDGALRRLQHQPGGDVL